MGYNVENLRRIKQEYATKYIAAREDAQRRRAELHDRFPEVAEYDRALSENGLALARTAVTGGTGVEAKLAVLREQNEAILAERAAFLLAHGYPADYSEIRYACPACGDTGYVGTRMCACMRRALILAGYDSSGLGRLLETQTFARFSLDYYRNNPENFAMMQRNYDALFHFAQEFTAGRGENFLLIGPTGLGKTHLSSAVARVVIERGYDVCYTTAVGLLGDFEYDRFKSGRGETSSDLDRYVDCDLLIIDDFGTEVSNQFSVSVFYNVINTRLNRKRSTIVNTNLTQKEIRERYADRITSRLFGEYRPMRFAGIDVRAQRVKA